MFTTKRIIFAFGLLLGLVTLMGTTCNKEDNPPDDNCTGYIQATASGYINQSFCFDSNPQYTFDEANELLNFSANVTIDGVTYSCDVSVSPYSGPNTYNCGSNNPGYVELILHGDESEYYKSQSGTVTVTQADATHFVATFTVEAKGYYNEQTVNISGSVMRVQ